MSLRCGNCGTWGHNYRRCKNPPHQKKNKPRWKKLGYTKNKVSLVFLFVKLNSIAARVLRITGFGRTISVTDEYNGST